MPDSNIRTRDDDLYTMSHPESWSGDVLPMRNKTTGQRGYLPFDAPLTVCMTADRSESKAYASADEMLNAGWVVD